jgi:hypothetical protein
LGHIEKVLRARFANPGQCPLKSAAIVKGKGDGLA